MKSLTLAAMATALVAGASARAAGPTLSVAPTSSVFAAAGTTILRFNDDGLAPTATIDVYAASGYGVDLSQPFGSTIGGVDARAKTTAGAEVHLAGALKSAEPAAFAAAAAACTPERLTHDAVWTLGLNGGGIETRVPVFVDGSSESASAQLRICLPQPGSPGFDLRLTRATLTLNNVFTNPAAAGDYRWTTVFTTYSPAGAPPSSSQTLVRLPPRLTLARKLIRARSGRTFVRLAGSVTADGRGVSGVRVEILAGPRASQFQRLAYSTSYTGGKFSVVAALRGKTYFRARVAAPLRQGPLSQCAVFPLRLDAVCTSLTLAPLGAQSRTITATPARGRVRP